MSILIQFIKVKKNHQTCFIYFEALIFNCKINYLTGIYVKLVIYTS